MNTGMKPVLLQVVVAFSIFGLALFIPAGTLGWPAAWVFLGMFLTFSLLVFGWLYKNNPGLLRERMRLGTSDQQGWDRILFPFVNLLLLTWLVFDSLDARRFHWSSVSIWLQLLGAALLLISFCVLFLTFRANSYLSPVVRLQTDRGHTAVSTGPYHYVRHPMYSAILVFVMGASLRLGSAFGVLWMLVTMVVLGRRAVLEERMLRNELPGYSAYGESVKYRFIPFVW